MGLSLESPPKLMCDAVNHIKSTVCDEKVKHKLRLENRSSSFLTSALTGGCQ